MRSIHSHWLTSAQFLWICSLALASRRCSIRAGLRALLLAFVLSSHSQFATEPSDPWNNALRHKSIHQFSTLFTAQDVAKYLAAGDKLQEAIGWCRQTGVTKVYLEVFRDGYHADSQALARAKLRFVQAGFEVSGCVTTTHVGKKSDHWNTISCYTDLPTQDHLQKIFEDAAGLFDEIMIDDFWFTDCTCAQCEAARQAKKVTVGNAIFSINESSWEAYRGELMARLSEDRIINPAKKINPRVQLIIKYPQWYDRFHERGYDVARETALFDRIWVGTESRDYKDAKWGGTVQYESYFIMRWLGGIGGDKCGGGWYDWLGTTEHTYLEQARQTILGGAKESMLFCYGGLQSSTGPKDIAMLRSQQAELFAIAEHVRSRPITGIAAYKPANSAPEKEARVFDFVGMIGFPLLPCHEFPSNAPAAFFSAHSLKDPQFIVRLSEYLNKRRPVLITDGLASHLFRRMDLRRPNLLILPVKGDPQSLLDLPQSELDRFRAPFLQPFRKSLQAPPRVALYLFQDGSWVVENFNDETVTIKLDQTNLPIPGRGWTYHF